METATHILTYLDSDHIQTVVEGTPKALRAELDKVLGLSNPQGSLNAQWTRQQFISIDMMETMYTRKLSISDIQDAKAIIFNRIEMKPELLRAKAEQEQEELKAKQKKAILEKLPLVSNVTAVAKTISYVDNKNPNVTLHKYTTVVCKETGITEQQKITSVAMAKLELQYVHPFSNIANVNVVLDSYERNGLDITKCETQEHIAGMLITLLRSLKLLQSNDFVKTNLCLQQCKPETLGYALRYFKGIKSTLTMPRIHLPNEALYDFTNKPTYQSNEECVKDRIELSLCQYIKDCRGENEGQTKYPAIKIHDSSRKVRIYGGNMTLEQRQATSKEKLASKYCEQLQAEETMSNFESDRLEKRVDDLPYMDDIQKTMTAKWIRHRFHGETGNKLAKLFETHNTTMRDSSLISVTHAIKEEQKPEELGYAQRMYLKLKEGK